MMVLNTSSIFLQLFCGWGRVFVISLMLSSIAFLAGVYDQLIELVVVEIFPLLLLVSHRNSQRERYPKLVYKQEHLCWIAVAAAFLLWELLTAHGWRLLCADHDWITRLWIQSTIQSLNREINQITRAEVQTEDEQAQSTGKLGNKWQACDE